MSLIERTGSSARNIRRIVSRRVQENIQNASSSHAANILENNNRVVNNLIVNGECTNDSSDSQSDNVSDSVNSSSSESLNHSEDDLISLRDELRDWAINQNITGIAIQELLRILKKRKIFNFLPSDHKTLLRANKSRFLKHIYEDGSQFCYFGLENSLRKQLLHELIEPSEAVLDISISVDGLPISKSNSNQFWPIQAICSQSKFGVFLIGIYYGKTKPQDVSEYFKDLIEELALLSTSGFYINSKKYLVKLSKIIADAPARSFVKQCKNHNSYHGCEKCIDKGTWKGRVIFESFDAPLRTFESFKSQHDINHHTGISPLIQLDFDLVNCVPIDYMHLICLGVVRKLLRSWVKGPLPYKLSPRLITKLNSDLRSLSPTCPKEFVRKPRTAKEIDLWKATEFRTFLLYTGPVVLKNILSKSKYQHFLLLSIATSILVTKKATNVEWNNFANQLMLLFVKKVKELYSQEFLVYNVHNLIHISADALKFGPLDSFSAFP